MRFPKPKDGESLDAYIARCAEAIAEEFPDDDEREQILGNEWRRAQGPDAQSHVALVAVLDSENARVEDLHGRRHRVVPATLVRSGIVLHNNLGATMLPAEDVTDDWARLWNGSPVVTDHPNQRGVPASARDPGTLNSMGIGWLFRVRAENGDLKGDVFLDEARRSDVPDLGVILEHLDEGKKVELSTGFPVSVEEKTGTATNGEQYDRVLHPAGADHLAVFAQKTGACSVTDGCGLAQNHEGPCENGDEPKRGFVGFLKHILSELFAGESDEDQQELLRQALQEQFGGDGKRVWVAATYSDEGAVVFEVWDEDGDDGGLFRTTFELSDTGAVTLGEDAEEVRRVTTFEPVAMSTDGTTPVEGSTMNRDQMIAHLAEAGTDRAALEKLSDCQIKALYAASDSGGSPANNANNGPPEGTDPDVWERMQAYRRENDDLKSQFGPAQNAINRRRTEQLDDLLYHGDVAYSPEELKAMNAAQVDKLYRTVFPQRTSYVGLGAPRGGQGSEVAVGNLDFARQGILSGGQGQSVLDDPKEA